MDTSPQCTSKDIQAVREVLSKLATRGTRKIAMDLLVKDLYKQAQSENHKMSFHAITLAVQGLGCNINNRIIEIPEELKSCQRI